MSKNGANKRHLRTNQRRAIDALLSGLNFEQAAGAAGVSERTLYRWRAENDFNAELRERSQAATRGAVTRLKMSLDIAITTLVDVMNDKDELASVRVRAAAVVVDATIKLAEFADIEQRLAELERVTLGVVNDRQI